MSACGGADAQIEYVHTYLLTCECTETPSARERLSHLSYQADILLA